MHRVTVRIAGVFAGVCLLGAMGLGRAALKTASPLRKSAAVVLLAGSDEERSPTAAFLYHAGYAPRIILTNDGVRKGWSREHQRNLYAIEKSEIELVKRGVPLHAIVRLPFRKSGTVYDALAVKDYALRGKLTSLIIVTSDYHAARSLWIFQRVLQGLPISISVAPAPSVDPLFSHVAKEFFKTVFYHFRFGFFTDPAEL